MRRLLLALALSAAPAVAHSASIADAISEKDCGADGVVPNETLRDKILAANKVPFSSKTLALYAKGDFGGELAKIWAECAAQLGCTGYRMQLSRTYASAAPLADEETLAPPGFRVEIGPGAPPLADRPKAFLSGDWNWLKVGCSKVPSRPQDQPEERDPDPFFGPPAFVIAKSEDDAGKDAGKRGFATAGYSNDKVADKTNFDLDLFLGFTDPFRSRNSSLTFQPFVSYQRHSAKAVDDLSLGMAALSFPESGGQIRLKGAWETDHRFVSSVWRADLGWTTPWLDLCEEQTIPGRFYATCELTVMADHADIAEVGKKEDLAKLSSFTRVGADLQIEFGHAIGDAGFATFGAKYSGRHDLDGEADAELATVSLGFAPGDGGRYKVSIDYTHGRDLTSLGKQRSVVLSIGFRN